MTPHLFWPLAYPLSLAWLFGCGWIGFGALGFAFRRMRSDLRLLDGYLLVFFSLAAGMGICMAALFALALSGHFDSTASILVALALLILATTSSVRYGASLIGSSTGDSARDWRRGVRSALPHALLLLGGLACTVSFAMHAPGHWDDTSYHLVAARFYQEHHSLALNEFLRFPLFPNHMELLFAFGLQLGGVLMAQSLATLPLFVMAVGLVGACREVMGSATVGLLGGILPFTLGPVRSVLGYAYVDNGLAMFCLAAFLAVALLRSTATPSDRVWIAIAGFMAGTAAEIKLFGVIWAAIAAILALASARPLRNTLLFVVVAAACGCWWYVRSFLVSGDPIHPLGARWFGYYLWNQADLLGQTNDVSAHGIGTRIDLLIPALVKAKMQWVLPALFVPIFFRRAPRGIWLGYAAMVLYLIVWFYAAQVGRYLGPVLGVASFLTGFFLYCLGLGRLEIAVLHRFGRLFEPKLCALLVLLAVVPYVVHVVRGADQRMTHWEAELEGRPGYALYQRANAIASSYGDRLLQIGFENGAYFFGGLTIGDWFGPARYSQVCTCEKSDCTVIAPAPLAKAMEQFGTRMVIVNTKRFHLELPHFEQRFAVQYRTDDGYLLVLRE